MLIQLVLVYCLTANTSVCAENRPIYEEPLTLASCLVGAQQTAAAYLAEHPQWRLQRWRCEINRPDERHS